jgi:N-acylglucosamine 2-epimerase
MSEIHIKEEISNWKDQFRAELFENVLPFWLKYSIDQEKGGFFACLDNDGEIYDRRKFMWLNGRQIWMFARLAMRYSAKDFVELSNGKLSLESRAIMLESAYRAAVFMFTNGVREDGMVYFSLAEDGRPYHFERKIFSACFLCLGMATLGVVLRSEASTLREKGEDLVQKALHMLHNIISWSHDPSPLNRPSCPGAPATSPMNVPMILLNLLDEFRLCGALSADFCAEINKLVDYNQEERWCIEEIVKHVRKSEKIVLEVVGKDGSVIPGYDGRHMNPGHAIEAGWFVFNYAKRTNNQELIDLAVNMVDWFVTF